MVLLGVGGLRWGEAAALRVSDVDFLRRRIELHRNAVTVGKQTHVGAQQQQNPRRRAADVRRGRAGADSEGQGSRRAAMALPDGRLSPPSSSTDSWLSGVVARCEQADPTFARVTAHALRHTAASLAISAGANPKAVADARARLGRDDARRQADLFDSDLDAVAATLDDRYSRGEAQCGR